MYKRARYKHKLLIFNKYKKRKNINKIIILIICLFLSIIFTFKFINKKVSPILFNYAQSYVKKISNLIIK